MNVAILKVYTLSASVSPENTSAIRFSVNRGIFLYCIIDYRERRQVIQLTMTRAFNKTCATLVRVYCLLLCKFC